MAEKKGGSKLNVAIIHPDLGIGGGERLIVNTAVELASHGHKVHVFTSHHDKNRYFDETVSVGACNPREFSSAMAKLITDPQMAQRIAIEARRHVTESFSTKRFGQHLNQCIVDVARTKRD